MCHFYYVHTIKKFVTLKYYYWNFPYFADTTEREDRGWNQVQRQGENRVTLQITLFCDTRFHLGFLGFWDNSLLWHKVPFGFPWILGLRVGHRQRERERERELLHRYFLMVQRTFVFWQLRVRVKEGITSMTSSHRQIASPWKKHDDKWQEASSNAWQLENWVHQMFVCFSFWIGFLFCFLQQPLLALFVFCFNLDKMPPL